MMDANCIISASSKLTSESVLSTINHPPPYDSASEVWNSPLQYPYYSALAQVRQCKRVLEVGVAYGCSLGALALGSKNVELIVGVDNESAFAHSQHLAGCNLRSLGYRGALYLPIRSGIDFLKISHHTFDLIHLDGAKDARTIETEVWLSWTYLEPGGILVVNGTLLSGKVSWAIEGVRSSIYGLKTDYYLASLQGWWLAEKYANEERID